MAQGRKKVMLVDDNITNLSMGKSALCAHYDVYTVPSGEKLFKILGSITPDIILLDVEMPEMNGYEVIKILKADQYTAPIPVIFLTAKNDMDSELKGLSLGAIDYIAKPFSVPLLLKRVEVHLLVESQKRQLREYNTNLQKMVEEKTQTVLELQNAVFDLLTEVVEYRDDETGVHVSRTRGYYEVMVDALLSDSSYRDEVLSWDIRLVVLSSQLHDIGKVAIRDSILLKPDKLTESEFEEMKRHTLYGGAIIERIERNTPERGFIDHAKIMAMTHHERWDGRGYPAGLAGTDIPLQGRIMALVDVYDALISKRPYKQPYTHEEAVHIIKDEAGRQFDPELVRVFLNVLPKLVEVARSL